MILTQPDFPDAPQMEILFSMVAEFSCTETPEGDPALSLVVMSGGSERTMILAFEGNGGFKGTDERDRVSELVAGMVTETAAQSPSAAPTPSVARTKDTTTSPSPSPDPSVPPVPDTTAPSAAPEEIPVSPESQNAAAPSTPEKPAVSGLKAEHVIVKGHEFTASLTVNTVSLVRHENPKAAPLTVQRADITGVVAKVTAGGDPSLHLRVRAAGGAERTMVLVFSEWYSGGRTPERDEWAKALIETATTPEMPPAPRPARTAPASGGSLGAVSPGRSPPVSTVAGNKKFCTECGAQLSGSPRFCPNCGSPVAAGSPPQTSVGGIRDLPFDAAAEEERPAQKRRTRQKREKPEKRQRQPRTRHKASFIFLSQEQGLSEVPFFEKYLGFLAAPEDAFRYTKTDSFGQAIVYLAAILAIFGTVTSIILHLFAASLDAADYPQMAALGVDIIAAVLLIPRIMILGLVGILLWALVMHILLRIFGQSDDAGETFRTCAYAATPFGTVGLIPFFGPFFAGLWMLFLQYKGLVVADDVEERFALLAVAVPVIIFILIFYLFFSQGGSQ